VKLDRTSRPRRNPQLVIQVGLMRGDSFVTSGEVLMPKFSVTGSGTRRTIVVDLEWTFPLNFVEVVSGDGTSSNRQVIATTDSRAHGQQAL